MNEKEPNIYFQKAIVQGEDGNIFLSEHDGKGWICTRGQRTNYFAEGYIIEFQLLEE